MLKQRRRRYFTALRAFVFLCLRYSGLPWLFRELLQRRVVTIILYHDLPAATAIAHFRALRARYQIIALRDYLQARTEGQIDRLPSKALIVTLDDGHRGNYNLLPVLQAHAVPVTIFLCSGIVGSQRHYWWLEVPDRADVERLKLLPDEHRLQALAGLGYCDDRNYDSRHALSDSEIEEMKRTVDLQAHTITHPILPECPEKKAWDEIAGCKTALEQKYALQISALAYPNGDYSPREIAMLKAAGYTCGLTVEPGFNDATTDLYRLRRIQLPDDATISEVLVKVSGLWRLKDRIFRFAGSQVLSKYCNSSRADWNDGGDSV
jgi:peptidoglycan/xylan/chitin deacetylase (PgdA/CDA1 family)